ncbi:hypothetical protein ACT3CD_11580 [Geofilum sp. OHC36d9]|uniref:hypothetical protein n=1 Tax=Geofilum sp. OHC36d9 TaxID=3458413 RepID=UPI004034402A
MITVIEDRKQIAKFHERFQSRLNDFFTEKIDCIVGFPGGSFSDTVRYSNELNIWTSTEIINNKYWNGFGIGRPFEGRGNSLNGEINFPITGINRSIAGAFAKQDSGEIIVLHRGKIGGGKKGIGKNFFINNYRGDFVSVIDGDRETEFCLIGELESNHFPRQVSNFISEIHRVKNLHNSDKLDDFSVFFDFNYTNEKSGTSVTERTEPIVIERTHGIVVNSLASMLERSGLKIGNDRNRDLFTYNEGKVNRLFEIKTNSSTQSLYSAIGQLLIYSIPVRNNLDLIAVLPDKLNKIVENRFEKLGIKILYYDWIDNKPDFINLNEIIEMAAPNK